MEKTHELFKGRLEINWSMQQDLKGALRGSVVDYSKTCALHIRLTDKTLAESKANADLELDEIVELAKKNMMSTDCNELLVRSDSADAKRKVLDTVESQTPWGDWTEPIYVHTYDAALGNKADVGAHFDGDRDIPRHTKDIWMEMCTHM